MIVKEKSIGLAWFSTNKKLLLFTLQARPHPADIFNWTNNWTCFWKFGGNCPIALPLIAGSAGKTCQHHVETRAANVWDLVQGHQ